MGHLVHPLLAHQLLALPVTLVKHEQAQFGFALGVQAQPPSGGLHTVGCEFPIGFGDVQGCENAFPHIIQHALTRHTRDNHRQRMGTHRVVGEPLAHVGKVARKPGRQPVGIALGDA